MDFATARSKRRYNSKYRDIEFKEGDKVYLRLHRGYHLPGNPSCKLSQQRARPFVIKRCVSRIVYELDFPPEMAIYPVISAAHLSPTPPGDNPFDRVVPPPGPVVDSQSGSGSDDPESGDDYEVEVVLNHKLVRRLFKYLIKWKGWGNEYNVWKTEHQLRYSIQLVNEYWARQGGQPLTPPAPAPRKNRQ